MPDVLEKSKHQLHAPSTTPTSVPSARFSLLALATVYTLFVIYGSLVPLKYQHHSWQEAVETFTNIPYLNLGIGSRADWVANILLFVPLAFLWLGTLWHSKSIAARITAALSVLLACCGLSLAIEFTQIFFPPRTVSLNDIYAETLGALIGLTLWWISGPSVTRWYLGWRAAEGPLDLAKRLLYGYLFLLFGYNLLPLDLTISPVEIYHKWHEGRINLIPFTHPSDGSAQQVYGLLADVLIWLPAGMLARLATKLDARPIWFRLSLAAALLEFFQLFVFTRVTDTTDILTGSLGAAIGIWLAGRWHPAPSSQRQHKPSGSVAGLIAGLVFWLVVVYAVFWYPFDFQTDGKFLSSRLAETTGRVPFATYYFGTEYRAATEVLHKVGFFFPLGMLLASLTRRISFGPPALWKMVAVAGVAIISASVELGQLFLPGKFADPTDWVLEMVGGWAGCALAWRIRSLPHKRSTPVAPVLTVSRHGPWLFAAGLTLGLALLLLAATHISAVPYNVRELVSPEYPILSALTLACAVVWILGFPSWAVVRLVTGTQSPAFMPCYMLLHAIVAWMLLRLAVPLESIHDIVGSPILGWPWELEMIGRFTGLFALWSVIAFGSALLALRPRLTDMRGFLGVWMAVLLALLPVSYVVVIQQAVTDNLTELLSGNGTPGAFVWITVGLFFLALAGSQLATALGTGMRVGVMRGTMWSLVSFPATYFALNTGFEPYIMKYGQVFSAFQFLLSQDRSHYSTPVELLLRYGFAHILLLLVIATCQAPFLGYIVRSNSRQATGRAVERNLSHSARQRA